MKITKSQLRQIIQEELKGLQIDEAQWGRFTGGAAPLDEPTRDSGSIPIDQLKKLWNLFIEMGLSPEAILQKPEFAEAGITDPSQLQESVAEDSMKEGNSSTTYYGLVEVPYEPSIILHGSSVEEIKEEAESYGMSLGQLVAIFTADIIEGDL